MTYDSQKGMDVMDTFYKFTATTFDEIKALFVSSESGE